MQEFSSSSSSLVELKYLPLENKKSSTNKNIKTRFYNNNNN